MNNNTALRARETKMIFISEAHENFYYESLEKARYQDCYYQALLYTLGISADVREHIDRVYDFDSACVKPECIHEGWITSGSARVVRLAFNLYCNGTPTVDNHVKKDDKLSECMNYGVEEIFCCSYAPFFWQAIKLRYPEYALYNYQLHQAYGGRD